MRLSRRSFVQASIVAPVFAQAIAACADDPKENLKPDPIERVSRDVHLALPQLAGWTPEEQAELVVGIGGANFKVKQHTKESLTSALGDAASTLLGSLEFPTHWVDDAPFSAEGVQSYVVGLPDSTGNSRAAAQGEPHRWAFWDAWISRARLARQRKPDQE
jgi:hypothetical protein